MKQGFCGVMRLSRCRCTPFVIGLRFRIKYLDKALDYMFSHSGVWKATGAEIAHWYYPHYYKDAGNMKGEAEIESPVGAIRE